MKMLLHYALRVSIQSRYSIDTVSSENTCKSRTWKVCLRPIFMYALSPWIRVQVCARCVYRGIHFLKIFPVRKCAEFQTHHYRGTINTLICWRHIKPYKCTYVLGSMRWKVALWSTLFHRAICYRTKSPAKTHTLKASLMLAFHVSVLACEMGRKFCAWYTYRGMYFHSMREKIAPWSTNHFGVRFVSTQNCTHEKSTVLISSIQLITHKIVNGKLA